MARNMKGNAPRTGNNVSSGTATATAPRPTVTKAPQMTPSVISSASGRTAAPTCEQIAQRAREIWTKNGCRPGQDEQNWLEAERQLMAELAGK